MKYICEYFLIYIDIYIYIYIYGSNQRDQTESLIIFSAQFGKTKDPLWIAAL